MRTIRTKVYLFNELNDTAKQKVIESNYDINVDYDWWDSVYDDAENIGLEIKGFDIGRSSYCKGSFSLSACEVAQNIINEHGETCETYKTAKHFLDGWQPVFNDYLDKESPTYESAESEEKMIEMEDSFLKSLLEDYRIILEKEYEYLTSEAAIIETIVSNKYEFTAEGNRI